MPFCRYRSEQSVSARRQFPFLRNSASLVTFPSTSPLASVFTTLFFLYYFISASYARVLPRVLLTAEEKKEAFYTFRILCVFFLMPLTIPGCYLAFHINVNDDNAVLIFYPLKVIPIDFSCRNIIVLTLMHFLVTIISM